MHTNAKNLRGKQFRYKNSKLWCNKMTDVLIKIHMLYTPKLDTQLSVLGYFFSVMLRWAP